MKITYVLLAIAFVLSLTTACTPKQAPSQKSPDPKTVTDLASPAEPDHPIESPADTSDFISADKAVQIALEKAGLSAKDVRIGRTDFDYDNGIWHYEVEFRQGNVEYDVDVKAEDGTILSFEKDIDD